mgnify:CR=1 FL=1
MLSITHLDLILSLSGYHVLQMVGIGLENAFDEL